jgi:NADPH-dependent glutamate synthase beta subunit-like oxidoreductase
VWEYYKPQVLPEYTALEERHQVRMWARGEEQHELGEEEVDFLFLHDDEDLVGLYEARLDYMSVPGVEHAYFRENAATAR